VRLLAVVVLQLTHANQGVNLTWLSRLKNNDSVPLEGWFVKKVAFPAHPRVTLAG